MLISVLENIPRINVNDDISSIIVSTIIKNEIEIHEKDIICVASKVISISENKIVELSKYKPSSIAYEIHKKVPRKDPRLLQAIIEETGDLTGKRLSVRDNYIGAWLKNGLFLTSAGIDRYDERNIILLPNNADISAQIIGEKIKKIFDKNVSVIITDSDGRVDKLGSTQVAIGVYGIPALRYSTVIDISSKKDKKISETICDMLAASAGLLMGQKGRNKPVVIISGFEYEFNNKSSIKESLYNKIIGGIEQTKVYISNELKLSDSYELEQVERKGLGHPDTLADGISEAIEIEYCRYCLNKFGHIPHHDFDEVMIRRGFFKQDYREKKFICKTNFFYKRDNYVVFNLKYFLTIIVYFRNILKCCLSNCKTRVHVETKALKYDSLMKENKKLRNNCKNYVKRGIKHLMAE